MDTKSLVELYKLPEGHKDGELWTRILDLDSARNIELDWHSSQTFQRFLDALDIGQPQKSSDVSGRPQSVKKDSLSKNADEDKIGPSEAMLAGRPERPDSQRSQGVETILSAEALKILSELPDLSFMSSTRSFIYPNGERP